MRYVKSVRAKNWAWMSDARTRPEKTSSNINKSFFFLYST